MPAQTEAPRAAPVTADGLLQEQLEPRCELPPLQFARDQRSS